MKVGRPLRSAIIACESLSSFLKSGDFDKIYEIYVRQLSSNVNFEIESERPLHVNCSLPCGSLIRIKLR